jgi:hypothetical protein
MKCCEQVKGAQDVGMTNPLATELFGRRRGGWIIELLRNRFRMYHFIVQK